MSTQHFMEVFALGSPPAVQQAMHAVHILCQGFIDPGRDGIFGTPTSPRPSAQPWPEGHHLARISLCVEHDDFESTGEIERLLSGALDAHPDVHLALALHYCPDLNEIKVWACKLGQDLSPPMRVRDLAALDRLLESRPMHAIMAGDDASIQQLHQAVLTQFLAMDRFQDFAAPLYAQSRARRLDAALPDPSRPPGHPAPRM